jgi:hydroxymethylpyrimidine pyrophosphatase-like HAD family hydrolase
MSQAVEKKETTADAAALQPSALPLLETEANFYAAYDWAPNIYPSVAETANLLSKELDRAAACNFGDWRLEEIRKNVFLLGSAVGSAADDFLSGKAFDFSKVANAVPFAGIPVRAFQAGYALMGRLRRSGLRSLFAWKAEWEQAFIQLLRTYIAPNVAETREATTAAERRAQALLQSRLPATFLAQLIRVPAAFRSQDLTHLDVLALGEKFIAAAPDRRQPVLVVGLRTAGSYFAPLLQALLENEGYSQVAYVTLRPKGGTAPWEQQRLQEYAARKAAAVVIDEPVYTGGTMGKTADLLRHTGFEPSRTFVLFPVHPSGCEWMNGEHRFSMERVNLLPLEADDWFKHQLVNGSGRVGERIAEYYRSCGEVLEITSDGKAQQYNAQLRALSDQKFHNRLKCVLEVKLRAETGAVTSRYVLAKSVGWGWYSYHAFLAGQRLAGLVPNVLGLRDGILYSEWHPHSITSQAETSQSEWIRTGAAYVAARVRALPLRSNPAPALTRDNRHKGYEELSDALSKAFGHKGAALLKRARLRQQISSAACAFPTLIDGKMRRLEWVRGGDGLLKSDFEHHGLGKTEMNMTDPAYDLAEAILHWSLSASEEKELVDLYASQSEDKEVYERLFLNKLIAGVKAINSAVANLEDARLFNRHADFNREYQAGWNHLVLQTVSFCARFCAQPSSLGWRAPLVSMDIDGVLDQQVFGYPSTTAAGMQAVSLLNAHGFAVAMNTARSLKHVKAYCQAYGFVGGAAEYGAYVWDRLSGREKLLVSDESLRQIDILKEFLRGIPGVFLNEDYQYSIRAYTYQKGTTVALPTPMIRDAIAKLQLDRLHYHQTFIDTAVVAKETDKGKALLALLELAGVPGLTAYAIGDSEPDLPMFAAAQRSFAPGNTTCRKAARAVGCWIADEGYQQGLLSIARRIVHPDGSRCGQCRLPAVGVEGSEAVIYELLKLADESRLKRLLRAVADPMMIRSFGI